MKNIGLFAFLVFVSIIGVGQIQVSDVGSVASAVQKLAGEGVLISNVTYSITGGSPIGVFKDDFGILGVTEGLMMTTGNAKDASGPNDESCTTTAHDFDSLGFKELTDLVEDPIYDLVVIEFDIQVATDLLEFSYVFGSDEYPEFIDGFHDVFGFFISGPGIVGTQNLAVIPGTDTPVSVGTINNTSYTNYYVANGSGLTPVVEIDVQYDGFTKPLTVRVRVEPCQVYHIKLAIADVNDQTCDSGVFLQNNSFSAQNKPVVEVIYEHKRFPFALEGCNDFEIKVSRGAYDLTRLDKEITYTYQLAGTATKGDDYVMVNEPVEIKIPIGEKFVKYQFTTTADGQTEGEENVQFEIITGCSFLPEQVLLDVPIKEQYEYKIADTILCVGNELVLNELPQNTDELLWQVSPSLSCENCVSPFASNEKSTWFYYTAKDIVSGCETRDSVFVEAVELLADFDFHEQDCYTVQDVRFINKSLYAGTYLWQFGDGETVTEENPIHTYGNWMDSNSKGEYNVTLLAKNTALHCEKSITKVIAIDEVLLIPNVMTPNGDDKNESLQIKGVIGECWELTIYNRYGQMILHKENYTNDWIAPDVTDGLYYYALQNVNGDRYFKGYILIVR